MRIKNIDHIGIAVKSIEQAGKFYTDILGLHIEEIETVVEQKVNVAFIPITDSEVELLESVEPDGPVAKYIESRGEGIQHIAFRVTISKRAFRNSRKRAFDLSIRRRATVPGAQKSHLSIPKKPTAFWWKSVNGIDAGRVSPKSGR